MVSVLYLYACTAVYTHGSLKPYGRPGGQAAGPTSPLSPLLARPERTLVLRNLVQHPLSAQGSQPPRGPCLDRTVDGSPTWQCDFAYILKYDKYIGINNTFIITLLKIIL